MRVLDGVPHESQREKHIGLARRVRAVDLERVAQERPQVDKSAAAEGAAPEA